MAETLVESLRIDMVAQQSRQAVRLFTCAEGKVVSPMQEAASLPRFRGSDAEVDDLLQHLERSRVLLLTAERGARKVSTAIYLGWRLRQEGRCPNQTLLVNSLDRQVRIDAGHLAEKDPGLAGRLVIFRRPFGRADPALTRLMEAQDRSTWEQLEELLREQDAYLVFTADLEDARQFGDHPAAAEHARELLPHLPDVLEEGLDAKLKSLEAAGAPRALLAALENGRETLLKEFRFAPTLAEFADFFVDQNRPEIRLDQAVARFKDTSRWLLQELEGDFEGWSFGFTLALAHAVRGAQGVPWIDFDRLHRRVRLWLRRDMSQRSPGVAPEVEPPDAAELHPVFSEMSLLGRCRAEIVKDAGTLADVIRFRDGTPPKRLWDVILGGHRRALTTILPGLREMAESDEMELRSLAVLAAQIIGRIGEVDPHRVAMPLMERWMQAPGQRHHMAVGAMYEGMMGGSDDYRRLCIRRLKQAAAGSPSRDPAAEHRLLAIIGACSWIGDHDLDAAMDELESIACRHLVPMIGGLQQFARAYDDVEQALKSGDSVAEGDQLLLWHTVLAALMDHIYRDRATILLGVQRSLVSLCLTTGPIPVFTELRRWIEKTGWTMGVLVALMFLHDEGIARRLKEARVEVGAGPDGGTVICNPLVLWIAAGEDEVLETAAFLGELYKSLTQPFAVDVRLRSSFQESLQGHLADWVRDSLPVPEYTDSMRMFFEALARTHRGVLHSPLNQLLAGREFNGQGDSRLRDFAASVRI